MRTITSPSGRMSTPRSTHAGRHASPPAQALGGRGQLDAGHQPPLADLAHPVERRDPLGQRGGQLLAASAATLASTSCSSISWRWRSATAQASAFPL